MIRIPSDEAKPDSVLRNRSFLLLWSAQLLSQTAVNALIYSLMVLVEEQTGSSVQMSILVLSAILPSVVFGMAAGVFVDRWNKKQVMVATNLLRVVAVLLFTWFYQSLILVYSINLVFSTVTQFFAPAEAATIPAVVRRKQLIEANGLFNLTFSFSQIAGFVFIGPALVKAMGLVGLFVAMAVVYAVCAGLVGLLRIKEPERVAGGHGSETVEGVLAELRQGWLVLVRDRPMALALITSTLANSLLLIVGMLAPGYANRVVGLGAEDAVILMAPGGAGIFLGILWLRQLTRHFSKHGLASAGLLLCGGTLVGLGLLGELAPHLTQYATGEAVVLYDRGFSTLVLAVMALGFVLGLAYAIVNIPAQTVLQERCPEAMRGRVFATQFVFTNAVSIAPLIFLGGLADLVGLNVVLFVTAAVVLAVGTYVWRQGEVISSPISLEGEA